MAVFKVDFEKSAIFVVLLTYTKFKDDETYLHNRDVSVAAVAVGGTGVAVKLWRRDAPRLLLGLL